MKTIPFLLRGRENSLECCGFYKVDFNQSLMKTVFLLLASLTVPHMLFIDGIFHKR